RLDAAGKVSWTTAGSTTSRIAGTFSQPGSVTADQVGSVVIAGSYAGGPASFGDKSTTTPAGADIFVAKLDNEGQFKWAKGFGGTMDDVANDVGIAASGNVVITGHFSAEMTFGDGTPFITAGTGTTVYVTELDPDDGSARSVCPCNGSADQDAVGIAI